MVIKEYGDKSLPKIVLLHPMLADGECMLILTVGQAGIVSFHPTCQARGAIRASLKALKKSYTYSRNT